MFERYREIQERRATEDGPEYGFTLIELLIVIIVLGILAAIVIFSLTGVTGQSEAAACASDAKTVETAVSAYYAENSDTYPARLAALTGHRSGTGRTFVRCRQPRCGQRLRSSAYVQRYGSSAGQRQGRNHSSQLRHHGWPDGLLEPVVADSHRVNQPKRPAARPGASAFTTEQRRNVIMSSDSQRTTHSLARDPLGRGVDPTCCWSAAHLRASGSTDGCSASKGNLRCRGQRSPSWWRPC